MTNDKLHFLSPLFLKYQSEFEKNPRSRVFAPLAESYRKVGMTDKALDILSQGIRYNPSYVMGYVGLAFCYFDMKQFNLAYSTLRPLVDSNRDNIRLQRLFADTCLELLRKDEALETFKYLLFLNPRDKDIAKLVTDLERELEEKNKPVHNPIYIPEEQLTDSSKNNFQLFDVNKLESTPKIDFDDWLHVDLNTQEKKNNSDAFNKAYEWNVSKTLPESTPIKKVEDELVFKVEPNTESNSNRKDENSFVTHTLVDLYCGQGHIEKALEILEKILILNPHDKRTIDKINEIKSLVNPFEEDDSVEAEVIEVSPTDEIQLSLHENKSSELIDLDDLENISEEDGRRALMNILDEKVLANISEELHFEKRPLQKLENPNRELIEQKLNLFLRKIKERALDYQNRF